MADLNEVRLIGRLTRDPDMRQIPSGQYVANFGLATGRKYKDGTGMLKEETTFIDITCWARLAEITNQYLRKGSLVYIGGRLRFESWADRETGKTRSKITVTAENVQFLDTRNSNNAGTGGNSNYSGGAGAGAGAGYGAPQDQWAPPMNDAPPSSPPSSPGADWNQPPMDEPPF